MIHDNAPHCVFKISELTKLIASQLVLISGRKSAVHLACSSRYLEEPVLSTLWETQSSLRTLLEVLPEQTRNTENKDAGWESMVRGLTFPLGKSNVGVDGYFSSRLWRIPRQRVGTGYNSTRLGCAESTWMIGSPLEKRPSPNYASTCLPLDGSQRYINYVGSSRNPTSLTPTFAFLHT